MLCLENLKHAYGGEVSACQPHPAKNRLVCDWHARHGPMPLIPTGGGGSYAAEAADKFGHVDHRARVRPYADLPVALGGTHAKFDPPPIDFGDFGLTCDDAPYYSRGEMADIDLGANRAFAGVEIGLDRVEGGVLHDHNHDRRREHRRQSRILEPVREMLGLDDEGEGALGSRRYVPQGMPSVRRESEHCTGILPKQQFGGAALNCRNKGSPDQTLEEHNLRPLGRGKRTI